MVAFCNFFLRLLEWATKNEKDKESLLVAPTLCLFPFLLASFTFQLYLSTKLTRQTSQRHEIGLLRRPLETIFKKDLSDMSNLIVKHCKKEEVSKRKHELTTM